MDKLLNDEHLYRGLSIGARDDSEQQDIDAASDILDAIQGIKKEAAALIRRIRSYRFDYLPEKNIDCAEEAINEILSDLLHQTWRKSSEFTGSAYPAQIPDYPSKTVDIAIAALKASGMTVHEVIPGKEAL